MAGEWASALGAAILNGTNSYSQFAQLRRQNERQDAIDAQNAKLQQLNMRQAQMQLDDIPRQRARQQFNDATSLYGSSAFDNPDVLGYAERAGLPLMKGQGPGFSETTGVQIPQSVLSSEATAQFGARKAAVDLQNAMNEPSGAQKHKWKLEEIAAEHSGNSSQADSYMAQTSQQMQDTANEILPLIDGHTTGIIGKGYAMIPTTDAYHLQSLLTSLKANITQKSLTEMRMASKTGGALGNVSNQENEMLANSLAALDQWQSADQLRAQVMKVIESAQRWERIKQAYGWSPGQQTAQAPAQMPTQAPSIGGRPLPGTVDEYTPPQMPAAPPQARPSPVTPQVPVDPSTVGPLKASDVIAFGRKQGLSAFEALQRMKDMKVRVIMDTDIPLE